MGGALALIALAALQQPPELPARSTLAGFRALESTSTIVYSARPEPAHVLRATYAFPARSRWSISAQSDGASVRALTYVRGATAASVDAGRDASRALEGTAAHAARAQAQMRLALLLWPHSHAWTGEGVERSCDFESGDRFRATLSQPSAATPIELAWCSSDGKVIDAFRAITWRSDGARSWPASFELWHDGVRVWSETVDSVDTKLRVVESFFVPPDRRVPAGDVGATSDEHAPRAMDVPGAWTLRTRLAVGATLDTAIATDASTRAAVGKGIETALESTRTIELDERGNPVAIVLRARGAGSPGEGWTFAPEAPAWTLRIADARAPFMAELTRLASALPKDAGARAAWLRLVGGANSSGVLVVTVGSAE